MSIKILRQIQPLLIFVCLALPAAFNPAQANFTTTVPLDIVTVSSSQRDNVFYVGHPVTFSVSGAAAARYEVRDYFGALVDQGACAPALRVNVAAPGWYKLYLYRASSLAPWGAAVGGTTFVIFRNDSHFPALPAKSVPIGSSGLDDGAMRGVTGMGPIRHSVDLGNYPVSAYLEGSGLEADIALDKQYYIGSSLAPFDPQRKRTLAVAFTTGTQNLDAVRQIVTKYQNDVTYWECRNEPMEFGISPANFVNNELKPFYQLVKSINPNLKVLGPATVNINPGMMGWLNGFFQAGGGNYIDAFSFNGYNASNGDLWLARTSMESLNALLTQYGLGNIEKWQTEQGYAAADYGAYLPRHQGRWTMMQFMAFEQYGIPKEHNHYWSDVSGYWDYPFFWENLDYGGGSLEPAAALTRVWSEEVYGTTFTQKFDFGPAGNNLYIGSLYTGPGKSVAVFMSAGSTDGQVTLRVSGGGSLHVVSAFGQESTLPVVGGQATLPVPEEPVYVELAAGQSVQVAPLNWGADLALAPGVIASSSNNPQPPSNAAYDVGKIINGQLENWFWNQGGNDVNFVGPWVSDPGWVQIALPSVQTIDHVVVYSAVPWNWQGTLLDYELQYDAGGQWVTIDHVQEPKNTSLVFSPNVRCSVDSYFSDRCIFQHHFSPVTTSKIRLLVHNVTYGGGANLDVFTASGQMGGQGINLREVEIYNSPADALFKPVPPTGLGAVAANGQTTLAWTPSAGATCYTVKRSTASGGPYATVAANVTTTNFGDTGLTNGLTYYYVVTATGLGGESGNSNEAFATPFSVPAPPPAPANLKATAGDGQVALAWDSVAGAAGYTVKRATVSGGPYAPVTPAGAVTGTSYADTALTDGTPYFYVVTAVNGLGEGPASNEASATPQAPPPPAAANLKATGGVGQVALSWGASVGAAGYTVKRATVSGGSYAPVSPAGGVTGTSYTDTSVVNGTPYFYVVTATGPGGEGPNSNEANATPFPSPPSGLRINAGGGAYTSASLGVFQADAAYTGGATWSFYGLNITGTSDPELYRDVRYATGTFSYALPAAPGSYILKLHFVEGDATPAVGKRVFNVLVNGSLILTNFDVFVEAGGAGKALVKSVPVTVPAGGGVTVTFQTLTYGAMVSAIELIPTGPAGPPTLPPAPTNLKATAGDGQVSLAWDGVAGATSYTVYRATTSGGPYTPVTTPGTVTGASYADTGLTDGTPYFYVVTAVNTVGEGPASNEAAATPLAPPPPAPANLKATGGVGQVALSWDSVAGATSYTVYRATTSGGPYAPVSAAGGVTGTSYADTSVVNGTPYFYVVTATGPGGKGPNSNEASATPQAPPPPAPANLVATGGVGQVALAWGASAGAAGYTVKRSPVTGGPYTPVTPAGGVTGTSYADTSVVNGTAYFYVVTATGPGGEGPASNEAAATPKALPATPAQRINAGGGAYTDTAGNAWQADAAFTGGAAWAFQGLNITGTSDPELYRDVRYSGGSFSYTLAATPGSYTLKLHFVEGDGHASAPGLRTFNVLVNGTTALSSLDVAAAAGGIGKALVKSVPVTVPAGGGGVTVTFQTLTYGAMVSALELVPAGPAGPPTRPAAPTSLVATAGDGQVALSWGASAGAAGYTLKRATVSGGPYAPVTPAGGVTGTGYTDTSVVNGTPYFYVVTAVNTVGEGPTSNEATATPSVVVAGTTTLRLNCGGGAYTDTAGNAWQADSAFTGGAAWSFQDLGITGTSDPDLYRTVRYSSGSFSYTLAAAPGTYTLKLHFVEGDGHTSSPGFRTFNVLVNGSPALSNFDIYAQAGLGKALVKSVPVTVPAGGGVTVTFQTLTYGAMVSALELVPTGTVTVGEI